MKRGHTTISVVVADRRFYEDVGFKEAATETKGTPSKKPTRRTRAKSADADD